MVEIESWKNNFQSQLLKKQKVKNKKVKWYYLLLLLLLLFVRGKWG